MALEDDLKNIDDNLKSLNLEGVQMENTFKDIGKVFSTLAKDSKLYNTEVTNAGRSVKDLTKEADVLAKITKDDLKSKTKINSLNKALLKSREKQAKIDAQINDLRSKAATLQGKERDILLESVHQLQAAKGFSKDISDQYEAILKLSRKINAINPFKGLAELIEGVPIISKLLKDMSTASDKFNDTLIESGSRTKALGAGMKEYLRLASKAAMVFLVGSAIKSIKMLDDSSVNLANQMNIGKMEAADMKEMFTAAAQANDELLQSSYDLIKAQATLGTMFGTTAKLNDDTLRTFNILTERMGIASEAAGSLANFSAATGQNFMDFTTEIQGTVVAETALSGIMIDQRAVINDIANLSSATKMSMQAQGQSLGKAAFEARKLGLNLADMEKIGNSLLDFEQSIANELEAELITGKELNLERARSAYLNNDMVTFTAEIAKNVGTAADFANMNKIAQDSIAASFGMQRDEFADMLIQNEALKKFSKEGLKTESEVVEEMRRRLLAGESYDKLVKKFGKSEMLNRAKNLSMQDKMNKMIEKMYDVLDKYVKPVFKVIDGLLEKMGGSAGILMGGLAALAIGGPIIRGVMMMARLFRGMRGPMMGAPGMGMPFYGPAGGPGGGMGGPMFMGGPTGGSNALPKGVKAGTDKLGRKFHYDAKTGRRVSVGNMASKASKLGNLGKVGRFAKFGRMASNPLALVAGIGLSYGADALKESGHEELGKATSVAGGAVSGAATGAMIGSIIPGVGTAIGGVVGGLIGGGMAAFSEYGEDTEKATEQGSAGVQEAIDNQTRQLTAVLRTTRNVNFNQNAFIREQSINYSGMN